SNRDIQFAMKVAREIVSDGRELSGCFRSANLPGCWQCVVLRLLSNAFRYREQTQVRIVGFRYLFCRTDGSAQCKSHVRLPRRNPHLADHDILNDNFALAFDREREWPPGL